MSYLTKWLSLFPKVIGNQTRSDDGIDNSLEYNSDGFPQRMSNDPVRYDLENAMGSQLFSNDERLKEKIEQSDAALDSHKEDKDAHANGIAGNAGSATVLKVVRKIGGVSFDGSADIDLPGVNAKGNQDTTGNADTATKATNDSDGNTINTTYLKKSGGTMTGALNLANGTSNLAGDDAYFGDMNVAGHFCVKGANDATGLALVNKDGSDYGEVRYYSNALHINKDLYIEGGACNASSGYSKLTNGVVIQWFQYGNTGNTTTSWPITFPNACFGAIADGNSRETRCYAFNQSNVSYAGDGTYGRVFGWGY